MTDYLEILKDLSNSFNFDELGFSPGSIAQFIVMNPGKAPFKLVYKTADGGTESDSHIRKGLSGLVGFELPTCVVLTRVITAEDLKDVEIATVGELRNIAKTFHEKAFPIDEIVAAQMWNSAPNFYALKYLLAKEGVELPDIQMLSSVNPEESDDRCFIDWNSACKVWDYFDPEGGDGSIRYHLPVFCYYAK